MNDAEKSFTKDDEYVWLKIGNSNISQKCIINWWRPLENAFCK